MNYISKQILITGGTGYLGQYIVNYYLERGFSLTLIIRSVTIVPERFEGKLDVIYLEDANFDNKIRSLKVDCFINAAVEYGSGINSESNIIWCNILFPIKILNLLETTYNFCFISFDSFYSKTLSFNQSLNPAYVLSKKNFLDWLGHYNTGRSNKIAILSIEHLVGSNESTSKFNGWFIQQCKLNSKEIQLTDGLQIRDFIFVEDVVSAVAIILNNCEKLENKINKFEVGSGKGHSLKYFCELIHLKLKSTSKLKFGGIPRNNNDILESIANNQDLLNLGWAPTVKLDIIIEKILNIQKKK